MEVCSTNDILQSPAAQDLRQFIRDRHHDWKTGTPDWEQFEGDLHEHMMALERQAIADELSRYDVDAEHIEVAGVRYHPVLETNETYLCAAGPVRVLRHLYRPAGRKAKSICPLELRAGIVAGYWTPRAARLGSFALAHLTATEAAALFAQEGAMQPSRSVLDRLPRFLSQQWEAQRVQWEAALRVPSVPQASLAPVAPVVMAVSVDGVMAPLKAQAGPRQAKRQQAGKHGSGPSGYREVGCGTVSLYDEEGERLQTLSYARMPERGKVTLQSQLQAEVVALVTRPAALRRVYLADGAASNWRLLAEVEREAALVPDGEVVAPTLIVDFYHACEHLKRGCDAIWGESSPRGRAEFERLKTLLKEDDAGAQRVIGSLRYHAGRATGRRQTRIRAELTYFRNQSARMHYAAYQREKLPIASGVMEAACKTLVTQRLKRSGMAWSMEGGQAILTLRSVIQSGRWPQAWRLLAGRFRQTVTACPAQEYSPLRLVA